MLQVVTDSTACLPASWVESAAIAVVPLDVAIREADGHLRTGLDDADNAPQVATALTGGLAVHTSQPPVERFEATYRRAAQAGANGIVSIHMSGALSGTCAAARRAAAAVPIPVRVIDSATTVMPLGGAAMRAAVVARGSQSTPDDVHGDLDRVESAVNNQLAASRVWFTVPDLVQLRRGGRIGAVEAFLGQGLGLRPVLTIADGRLQPVGVARGAARCANRIFEEAALWSRQIQGPAVAVVHHLTGGDPLEQWRDRARALTAPDGVVITSRLSAVIAAHAGPGVIGVALLPEPDRPVG